MKEGDVVLTPFPQADGIIKNRPALVLRVMPRFGDLLVCGISRQLRQKVENFDEIIAPGDADFAASGLLNISLIRVGFLSLLPPSEFLGDIGTIAPERHHRLLRRLAEYLVKPAGKL
jgi:mRNA interferase MazF